MATQVVTRYDGGKNAVWRQVVNQFPPHETYLEIFGGSGAVIANKQPARRNFYVEIDPLVLAAATPRLQRAAARAENAGNGVAISIIHGDALSFLREHRANIGPGTLIYADPPYLMAARSWKRDLYAHEFGSEQQHSELLRILTSLSECRACIVISGYRAPLYDRQLVGWRRVDFKAMTHRGPRIESLWCNFPEPTRLHEYSVLGSGWRERQRIQRKKARWVAKLERMRPLERAALIEAIRSTHADFAVHRCTSELQCGPAVTPKMECVAGVPPQIQRPL